MMTFQETLNAALADFDEHGYDSAARLDDWLARLKAAADRELMTPEALQARLKESLTALYQRLVDRHQILQPRYHAGRVGRFVPAMLRSDLRKVLEKKILASTQVIKLNKQATVAEVLQRFTGYVTSLPTDGPADPTATKEERKALRGKLSQLPFEERRVIIDQGHKLVAALSETIAVDGRAIAGRWHSQWRQLGYRYREDHKERDDKVYILKAGWAYQQGYVTEGDGFIEDIERPAELVFCRCWYQWLYSLSRLPPEFLTAKGVAALAKLPKHQLKD